jgi:hypothetical protein
MDLAYLPPCKLDFKALVAVCMRWSRLCKFPFQSDREGKLAKILGHEGHKDLYIAIVAVDVPR